MKMKRIISIALSALMLISVFATGAISAYAAEGSEGNWEVLLNAAEEESLAADKDVYVSTPGYKYTDNGFEIVPPKYENVLSRYTVISKTKYDATNFSIKILIDEFDTAGDAWLSFTFWSEKNGLAQGGNGDGSYGYGWSCLLRDAENFKPKDGKFSRLEGFGCGTKTNPGGWNAAGVLDPFTPKLEDGKQVIEFKVVDKLIYINGEAAPGASNMALNNAFRTEQGLAYFGISVKSGLKDAPVKFTILEVNGEKPTGSDSADPVNRGRFFGEMIDADTIPDNTPGVLFDGTLRAQNSKLPISSLCDATLTPEGTFAVSSSNAVCSLSFDVNDDYTVDIKDFSCVGIILKNFCTCPRQEGVPLAESCMGIEGTGIFYWAGDVLGADLDHRASMNIDKMVDITPEGSEDYYVLVYTKIDTEEFEGKESRIHGLRFDAAGLTEQTPFEIVAIGFFRDKYDIAGYASSREEGFIISPEDINIEDDGPIGPSAPIDPGEPEPDPEEDETTKPSAPVSSTSSGCGSVVGMGAIAIVVISISAGLVTFKKRKHD